MIIPLLAFDNKGARVGYGKGLYDRFLAQCNPNCIKIGVSLFEPTPLFQELMNMTFPWTIALLQIKFINSNSITHNFLVVIQGEMF